MNSIKGSFFVKLVSVGDLKAMGMSSLTALSEFFSTIEDMKKAFAKVEVYDFLIRPGMTLFIPDGFIPLITAISTDGLPDDVECIGMVVLLSDINRAKQVSLANFEEIASNLNSGIINNAEYKTWTFAGPHLKAFIDLVKAR